MVVDSTPVFLLVQIMKEDDTNWPPPDKVGRQELEIILGDQHISFTTTKLGSLMQVQQSKDPDGLRIFYYLVQVTWPATLLLFHGLVELQLLVQCFNARREGVRLVPMIYLIVLR